MKKVNKYLKHFLETISVVGAATVIFFVGQGSKKDDNNGEKHIDTYTKYYNDYKPDLKISIDVIDPSYENNEIEENVIMDDPIENKENNTLEVENIEEQDEPFYIDDSTLLTEVEGTNDIEILEALAKEFDEELVYNTNPEYIENVLKYIHNPKDDNIKKDYIYTYVTNLYDVNEDDLLVMYIFINNMTEQLSYLSTEEVCSELLNTIFNKETLNECFNLYAKTNNISLEYAHQIAVANRDNYIEGKANDVMNTMMYCLFHKLFKNIPMEFKINTILKEQNITLDELDIIASIALCEAMPHSSLDAFFVIDTGINRKNSLKWSQWVSNYFGDDKGSNIFYQFTMPGQFDVYKRGDYLCYYGKDKSDIDNYPAVIEALFRPEFVLHNCLKFLGNGYSGDPDKFQPGVKTNNFYRYFEDSDRISIEDRENPFVPKEDLSRVRK